MPPPLLLRRLGYSAGASHVFASAGTVMTTTMTKESMPLSVTEFYPRLKKYFKMYVRNVRQSSAGKIKTEATV